MAKAIQAATGAVAEAEDGGRVTVEIPNTYRSNPVGFVAAVGDVAVQVDAVSKIVINERTGTIVIGGAARISPAAVAQGSLTVAISTDPLISQPQPLTQGQTAVVAQQNVAVEEPKASVMLLKGNTIDDLVKALNAIKATPRDIIAILQALKEAGSLQGELEIL